MSCICMFEVSYLCHTNVFICLGVSFMSCICMFGSIIYVLYKNTRHKFIPKHTNTSIIYVLYLYVTNIIYV